MKCGACGGEIRNSSGICVHCAANEREGPENVMPNAERSPGAVTVEMRTHRGVFRSHCMTLVSLADL